MNQSEKKSFILLSKITLLKSDQNRHSNNHILNDQQGEKHLWQVQAHRKYQTSVKTSDTL